MLAHGVLTWFLLDRIAFKDFLRGLVAYIDLPIDLPNIMFCVIIKFHDLPEGDLRYTTISSHHVLRRKIF